MSYATDVEEVLQAIRTGLVTVTGANTDNVFDRLVIGQEGDIWSGLVSNASGLIHTWMVSLARSRTVHGELAGGYVAPPGTFWPIKTFLISGYYKYGTGSAATNNEKTFREIWHAVEGWFEEKKTLEKDLLVLRNNGLASALSLKRFTDRTLGYQVTGTVEVVMLPRGV